MDRRHDYMKIFDFKIFRDGLSTPWGFRLQGGVDFQSPLTVVKVTPLSAVDGYIKAGDVILSIDRVDASTLTHNAALNMIANAGSSISLTVLRQEKSVALSPSSDYFLGARSKSVEKDDDVQQRKEQTKKLADIMKSSLNIVTTKPPIKRTTSFGVVSPSVDITSFLPRAPPRRQWSTSATVPSTTPVDRRVAARHLHESLALVSPARGDASPVLEVGAAGSTASKAVGLWSPPLQHPHSRLVHLQYNSPMNVYSAFNVADSVQKMTASQIQWLDKAPSTKYLDDIRESSTYKFVQELEGKSAPQKPAHFEQSSTLKNMSRYFGLDE